MFNLGLLTISDKGWQGQRYDKSGKAIRDSLSPLARVVKYEVIPDEVDVIASKLTEWADEGSVDVILTTGGTGLGSRDVTPEATLSVVDKVVPGSPKAVRECLRVILPAIPHAVEIIKGEVAEHAAPDTGRD